MKNPLNNVVVFVMFGAITFVSIIALAVMLMGFRYISQNIQLPLWGIAIVSFIISFASLQSLTNEVEP